MFPDGDMASANPDHLESMILLNVLAPSRLALAVIPGFVSRGHGTLINISSTAALAPERFGGYSGTKAYKAYMLALSLRLQQELAGKGIHVQVVLPGAITKSSGVADHHHEFALARAPFGGFQQLGRRAAQEFLEFLG